MNNSSKIPSDRKRQNLIFVVSVLVVLACSYLSTIRVTLIPDTYSKNRAQEYTANDIWTRGDLSSIHPLYSKQYYVPIGLKIPKAVLKNEWFNILSPFVLNFISIILFLILLKHIGFSWQEAFLASVLTLYLLPRLIGLVLSFLGDLRYYRLIQLTQPNPFISHEGYNFRELVFPLVFLSILMLIRKKALLAGLFMGIIFTVHLKFGFRFFFLVSSCHFLCSYYVEKEKPHIMWKNIWWPQILFSVVFLIVSFPSVLSVLESRKYFENILAPRSESLLSPIGWLVKNEADDWLIQNIPGGLTVSFFIISLLALAVAEFQRRKDYDSTARSRIVLIMICTGVGLGFVITGVIWEYWIFPFVPPGIALTITLTKFWEHMWVSLISFGLIVSGLIIHFIKNPPLKIIYKWAPHRRLFFMLLVGFGAQCLVYCNKIPVIRWAGCKNFGWSARYYEIQDPELCSSYEKAYRGALNALVSTDRRSFESYLRTIGEIYKEALGPAKSGKVNSDSLTLGALWELRESNYVGGYKLLIKSGESAKGTLTVWKRGEKGKTILRSVKIPSEDYHGATVWLKKHLPEKVGIIQPPYLRGFNMLSGHIGFWDEKIDQHTMYMIPGYFGLGLARLEVVAGKYRLETNPGIGQGRVGPRGRIWFLNLKEGDFREIRKRYPSYRYLLTERSHRLKFKNLFQNRGFVVYRLQD